MVADDTGVTEVITELKAEILALKADMLRQNGFAATPMGRAFGRLEQLLGMAQFDPLVSIRAFRVIAECLICLREELDSLRIDKEL